MNTTKFKSFREIESDITPASSIQGMLREGWVLLDLRIRRPEPSKGGAFEDVAIYSLAHESENP